MKKFKKLLMGLLTATMVLGSVMTVNANPSIDAEPDVPSDSESFGYYEILPLEEENFHGNLILLDDLTDFNSGAVTVEALLTETGAASLPGAEKALKALQKLGELEPFTACFDVQPVGTAVDNNTHKFEIHVPTLTREMKTIRFLHFSFERNTWEVIKPSKVDYTNQIVTLKVKDLSPFIGLFSTEAEKSNSGSGSSTTTQTPVVEETVPTSPKTADVASTWTLWMAAAVMLVAAGTVVVSKKRNN